jgi:parallel beta-helix repeat protein
VIRGRIDLARLLILVAAVPVALAVVAVPASASTFTPAPGDDLAAIVSNAPAGSSFQLGAGVYPVNKAIHLKSGDSFVGLGEGVTILDGGNAPFDGVNAGNDTGVQISALTVRNFYDGILLGAGSMVDSVESGPNTQTGIDLVGDGSTVQNSYVHDNGRFGIYVNWANNVQVLNNQVIHNHTSNTWTVGYAAGIKVINFATNDLVQGNTVTNTIGHGIWTDNSSNGTQIIGNTVLGSTDEGIRLEKSYNTVVSGNTSDTGFNSLDSSGALVEGNTFSSPGTIWPLRFAGNGAKDSNGVEYANVNNTAQGNDVTIGNGQRVGVVRVAGTSRGNSFSGDTYHVPAVTLRWFSWWDGSSKTNVAWTMWTANYGQDLGGTLNGPSTTLTAKTHHHRTRSKLRRRPFGRPQHH